MKTGHFVAFVDARTATQSIRNNVSDNKIYGRCYHPQTKLREGNFLHLSVSLSVYIGGVCLWVQGVQPPLGRPTRLSRHTFQADPPPGRHPPPPRQALKQVVCILLECLLVIINITIPCKCIRLPPYEPFLTTMSLSLSSLSLEIPRSVQQDLFSTLNFGSSTREV